MARKNDWQWTFDHDLSWIPKKFLDLKFVNVFSKEALKRLTADARSTFVSYLTQTLHATYDGAQLWVAKEVSDDLMASDIGEAHFDEVPWVAPSLEFVFEDPRIPCFLFAQDIFRRLPLAAAKLHITDAATFEMRDDTRQEDKMLCMIASHDRCDVVNNTWVSDIDLLANSIGKDNAVYATDFGSLKQGSIAELKQMALLAYKVLLFADSDGLQPKETNERPTKKEGGVPGFRNRPPIRKRFRVVYLPRQRSKMADEQRDRLTEGTGTKKAFHGRHGHWRHYQADRYKEWKGRRQFILPIDDPNPKPGTIYKVKKPK